MGLEVIEGGLLTTVQDLGRYGYERFGVPVCGAMDPFALQAANALVGNSLGEAALEITLLGPTLRATEGCLVALAGADLGPALDGEPVPTWHSFWLPEGATLQFTGRQSGCRAYLAVAGGFDLPCLLGSRSTFLRGGWGGFQGRALRPGDVLPLRPPRGGQQSLFGRRLREDMRPPYEDEVVVRVVLGPQDDAFTAEGIDAFLGSEFAVGPNSDRMGYRLSGPRIAHRAGADIVSDGIALGAVQVPGDGQPIVMMADRQTTGGYTKIATVISADIPLLAQCVPGAGRVRFVQAGLEEAVAALREQAAALAAVAGPAAYRLAEVVTADGEYAPGEE